MNRTATQPPDPIAQIGRWFAVGSALICLVPIPLLAAIATTPNWTAGLWRDGFTLQWLIESWDTLHAQIEFSLRLALQVLLLDLLIGFPAAWVLSRYRFRGRQVLLSLVMLPVAVPGIAIALGLILAYPTWRSGGWLLLGGHLLYTLPFLIGALTPALGQPKLQELEAVAATLGSNRWQRFVFVVLPQTRSALLAAAIVVFTLSMGEFNVSFFLFTPIEKPLPIVLYAAYTTDRLEVAAANTLWFLLFVMPAAIAIESLDGVKIGQG